MAALVALDPVLARFRDAVVAHYGPALDRIVLFGSRARGDAHAESDYDVAVFLKDMPDRGTEWDRLTDLKLPFLLEGVFIDAIPFNASDYDRRTPIMHEIRKDGLAL